MITKGALEEVIKSCNKALIGNKEEKITNKIIDVVNKKARELEEEGMQVIALAEKKKNILVKTFSLVKTKKI